MIGQIEAAPTPLIQRVAINCTKLATAAYARGDSNAQHGQVGAGGGKSRGRRGGDDDEDANGEDHRRTLQLEQAVEE